MQQAFLHRNPWTLTPLKPSACMIFVQYLSNVSFSGNYQSSLSSEESKKNCSSVWILPFFFFYSSTCFCSRESLLKTTDFHDNRLLLSKRFLASHGDVTSLDSHPPLPMCVERKLTLCTQLYSFLSWRGDTLNSTSRRAVSRWQKE